MLAVVFCLQTQVNPEHSITQMQTQQGNIKGKSRLFVSWGLNSQRTSLINFTFKGEMCVKGPVSVRSLLHFPGDNTEA